MADWATTHVTADADGIAALVALARLRGPLRLVLPGSMDRAARRIWRELGGDLPEIVPLRRFRREVAAGGGGRLWVVDTARAERLGEIAELLDRFDEVRALDTHPEAPGDLPREPLPRACACTSPLVLALREAGTRPPPVEAGLFLVGIHVDTGHFTHPGTTAVDHEAASACLGWGAPADWPRRFLPRGYTRRQLELLERMAESVRFEDAGGVRVAVATLELRRWEPELSELLAELREAEGWPAAFLVLAAGGRVRLIGRSDGEAVDVGAVLRALGGGGHAAAGSASLPHTGLMEARALLRDALGAGVRPRPVVRDLADREFFALAASTPVRAAADALALHRVNAVPLYEEGADGGRRWTGQASRQELDIALRHGLGDRPAVEVSPGPPPWVAPGASLLEARRLLLSRPGRLLLVGEEGAGEPEGLLTRTAVLRALADQVAPPPRGRPPQPELVVSMVERALGRGRAAAAWALGELAAGLGMRLYLVGGCVRDALLGQPTEDADLVVEGDALELLRRAVERLGGRVHEHHAFRTGRWLAPGGHALDVTTARAESYDGRGALPGVRRAGLRRDLFRRDFTINAIAISALPDERGRVLDFYGGIEDLRRGVLRVLHGLSFHDDPTRAWRAARFAARLDFRLAPETEALLRAAIAAGALRHVSPERTGRELDRILGLRQVARALRLLRDWRVLPALEPVLRVDRAFLDGLAAAVEARHRLDGLLRDEPAPPQADVLWVHLGAALPRRLRERHARLVPGGRARRRLFVDGPDAVARAGRLIDAAGDDRAAVGRALEGLELAELACLWARRPEHAARLAWWAAEGRRVRPALSGADLVAAGVPEGPAVGAGLRAALDAARRGAGRAAQLEAALGAAARALHARTEGEEE